MSSLDYMHGAAVQEIISNSILDSELQHNSNQWRNYSNGLQQDNQKLRQYAKEMEAFSQKQRKSINELIAEVVRLREAVQRSKTTEEVMDYNRKVDLAKMRVKEIGAEVLLDEIDTEASASYNFATKWVDTYAYEVTNEFMEGLKQGMKDKLGMSSSMAHRKRFMTLFEAQALEAVRNNKYVVDEKAMGEIARSVAIKVYDEIRHQQRALQNFRHGNSIKPTVLDGPKEIEQEFGKGEFKANPYRDEVKK